MALARTQSEWDRTAAQMALVANCHRDPRKHGPFCAKDFHPFQPGAHGGADGAIAINAGNIRLLKKVFVRE